jgi:hypothetical protein
MQILLGPLCGPFATQGRSYSYRGGLAQDVNISRSFFIRQNCRKEKGLRSAT